MTVSDLATGSAHELIKSHQRAPRITNQDLIITDYIRDAHPDHYLTTASSCDLDLEGFAEAKHAQMELIKDPKSGYYGDRSYRVPAMRLSQNEGSFSDNYSYSRVRYTYEGIEYIIYHIVWQEGECSETRKDFILSPRNVQSLDADLNVPLNDKLIKAVSIWSEALHDEIYVFDNGFWQKNSSLFESVQKSSWSDVILDATTKSSIISDVVAFFDNRALYEEFNVQWKRGIILHGSPGNGKTITIKALMRELGTRQEKPIPSMYVKSLTSQSGGEWSIRAIFSTARQMAPCMLIFEDLDSLVTDELRSYFLNEVDGLESNDGILMVGSTNHLGKLDPAIAKRPSRFDRKYMFRIPAQEQRLLYAQYWQKKLEGNTRISFDSEAAAHFVEITDEFSFAYLKELLLTSLLIAVGDSSDQIETELDATIEQAKEGESKSAKTAKAFIDVALPESLKRNKFVQIIHKQAAVLRYEMASADEAKNEATNKDEDKEEKKTDSTREEKDT